MLFTTEAEDDTLEVGMAASPDGEFELTDGRVVMALLTTVFGLIVAMILQVFYNYIVAKVDSIVNDMEDASISLIDLLVARKIK